MTRPDTTRPRLILFGIDGATFDIIEPAAAAGKLPNLARLLAQGSHQVLNSVIPPITSAAWPTIMTGVNPGKHGLFEFYAIEENSRNNTIRLVTSQDRQAPAIWDLLNQAGLSVGVLNVPMTYPPEEIDGWMISGMMGAPSFGKAACFPSGLARRVTELVGHYPMSQLGRAARGYYDFALLQQQIDSRRAVTTELLREHPVDVLIVVCNYTDHVQHRFWRERSYTTAQGKQIEDMIIYAYQEADRFLGELLDFCGEQTRVFVVSDHGAGPAEEFLNMDRFLVDNGLVVLANPRANRADQWGYAALMRLKSLAPRWLLRKLPAAWREQVRTSFLQRRLNHLDWARTRAFNIGTFLGLRLNVKGREPQGCIAPEDYDEQRRQIRALLEDYRHPHTGASVFEVCFPEELYHGPHLAKAPDLLGTLGVQHDMSLAVLPRPDRAPVFVDWETMQRLSPSLLSGGHRMAGMLIAAGPPFAAQALKTEAQLVDLVPTMLYALGLPIPAYCDGQVLTDLFTNDFADTHPPQYEDMPMQRQQPGSEGSVYSEEESEQVSQRLRDLGYLG